VAPAPEVAENDTFWPKKLPRMSAAVLPKDACVSTNSGTSGALTSEVKFGSALVPVFPVEAALWIAVTGLQ
jgi:hypothetical protein